MSQSNAIRRLAMYTAKLDPDWVRQLLDARSPEMIKAQAVSIAEQTSLDEQVRAVLASEPVPAMDYLKYRNFSREVFRKKKTLTGYALNQEVAILVAKYTARNCLESVLVRIRDDIFTLPAPPA